MRDEMHSFAGGRVTLYAGDCLDVMSQLPSNSVDAIVTDPPYHLTGSGTSRGFMGKTWDGGDVAFRVETWRAALRVLKPGGHLAAFSGSRTYHRMVVAIEDAGFEIRDQLQWLYGTGFPKSHDVSKGIDRALGAKRETVRIDAAEIRNPTATGGGKDGADGATRPWIETAMARGYHEKASDIPASDEALRWQGWDTALKPAHEPIVLARKPLAEPTVAANVLAHGTGAINIDACRIQGAGDVKPRGSSKLDTAMNEGWARPYMRDRALVAAREAAAYERANTLGRWPANVLHDGSDEVVAAFPNSTASQPRLTKRSADSDARNSYGAFGGQAAVLMGYGDSGSAARFFFSAKADADDRLGSKHPTVKPVDLMRWLVRLVTPPGGVVLDLFAGTGTTGEAAWREGFGAVLIEREAEYRADIARRMTLMREGALERRKAANAHRKPADLPLFGGGGE